MSGGITMKGNKCCRYYVFDKYTNEFIEENGELATVSEKFVKDMKKDIKVSYLTFIEEGDLEDFVKSQVKLGW